VRTEWSCGEISRFHTQKLVTHTVTHKFPLAARGIVPRPQGKDVKWLCANEVCLSVAYIGSKSRTERPGKTDIGTEFVRTEWPYGEISRFRTRIKDAHSSSNAPTLLLTLLCPQGRIIKRSFATDVFLDCHVHGVEVENREAWDV